jgi:hypothetical protein
LQHEEIYHLAKRVIAIYNPDADDSFKQLARVSANRYGQPIIKPSERMGFYNSSWPEQRRYQGELASAHGIYGFAMYYSWARDRRRTILELMLADGYPSTPFCLIWDNYNHNFTYEEWRIHFEWLLQFLRQGKYIRHRGKPLVMILIDDMPHLQNILATWQKLAQAAGIGEMHFVQMNGGDLKPGFDSTAEFFPELFPASGFAMNEVLSRKRASPSHFWGLCSSVDTTPTSTLSSATIIPSHPKLLYFWLRQSLARTPPGGIVFLKSWNDWDRGLAIEPSIQWGRRWLKAIHAAIRDEKSGNHATILDDGFVQSVPLVAAGVELHNNGESDKVCIVIRTYAAHATGMYNIHQLINSLLRLNHRHWAAFIVDTDIPAFSALADIVARYDHGGRISLLRLITSTYFTNGTTNDDVPFDMTDYAIQEHCMRGDYTWMLVTNGDNWYTPDALDYLPDQYDLVLMNFYSRYSALTAAGGTRSDPVRLCCARVQHVECMVPSPVLGYVDLGAMVIGIEKYRHSNLSFHMFNAESARICGKFGTGGCHDGLMADRMRKSGWMHVGHHSSACAMHHNANPASCEMLGGIWFDVPDSKRVGCHYAMDKEIHDVFAESNSDLRFTSSKACVC